MRNIQLSYRKKRYANHKRFLNLEKHKNDNLNDLLNTGNKQIRNFTYGYPAV